MDKKIKNPLVFPAILKRVGLKGNSYDEQHEGMTLRDYFAAKAMQSLVNSDWRENVKYSSNCAIRAYIIADGMLKERKNGSNKT